MSTVIEAASLRSHLVDWGLDMAKCEPKLPKPRYALAAADWLLNGFRQDWVAHSRATMLGYEAGSEVCTDYARECACYAAHLHRLTSDRPSDTGLAFGEWWFELNAGMGTLKGHAVCIVPVVQGGVITPLFFDPIPSKQINLSQKEINSCEFCRF